jgi:Flp pilus assembly protein TadB
MSPSRVQVLLTDPLGMQMLAGAVLMQIVGTLIIRRIVDIRY